jgi:hypothetical protein
VRRIADISENWWSTRRFAIMSRAMIRRCCSRHPDASVSLFVGLAFALSLGACRRQTEVTAPPEPGEPAPAREPIEQAPLAAAPPVRAREPGTIFADELARATERGPGWLLRQLGPEPHRSAGKFDGWTITARFPDDPELAAACDLELGDLILAVEGDPLATPTAYSRLFERADELETLQVTRIRGGTREELVYRIAPAPLPERPQARYHRPR